MTTKIDTPLKRARKHAGLTLHDVAARLKAKGAKPCSLSTVHCWERGWLAVPPDVAPILCRILRVRRLP